MRRAVVLFSGGLDSMLCVRILQQQGFEVDALNVRTVYACCRVTAAQTAVALGARLTVLPVGDDYLDVIRNPSYGYGKGVNPCIDCRIFMCRMAKRFMQEVGACVVATGEILGQRPMSQKRNHLQIVARRSGLDGRLLRPLSAKLLEPTIPEREGWIDRAGLYDFNGRGRRKLIELAHALGVSQTPSPSTGCALTEPLFAPRVRDLMQHHPLATRWDFELLSYGRHLRFNAQSKVVVGRNAGDNAALRSFASREDALGPALLVPEDFRGPDALVVGRVTESALRFAAALTLRYARLDDNSRVHVRVIRSGAEHVIPVHGGQAVRSAATL